MYAYLGGDLVVRADEVVAVLDIRAVRASALNQRLLDRLSSAPAGASLAAPCRAVVVTRTGVLPCPLSVETVWRRLGEVGSVCGRARAGGQARALTVVSGP